MQLLADVAGFGSVQAQRQAEKQQGEKAFHDMDSIVGKDSPMVPVARRQNKQTAPEGAVCVVRGKSFPATRR
ncbi:hypothetical protein GCM10023095_21900 [Pseudaeromonas paramecii]|uniref:Uncharacterized protein n=1 Tax=Pseudaeromonas paramecii TaxID=2138166 RepID=A0ABP8QD99_9GAMM